MRLNRAAKGIQDSMQYARTVCPTSARPEEMQYGSWKVATTLPFVCALADLCATMRSIGSALGERSLVRVDEGPSRRTVRNGSYANSDDSKLPFKDC